MEVDASENSTNVEKNASEGSKPKIKHDWYQTETHVIVTILVKNTDHVKVLYKENYIMVSADLPSGDKYTLELNLANSIVVNECSHKVTPSKIEIKMKKRDGIKWTTLERDPCESISKTQDVFTPKYPTSCKVSRDWDKVEKEIVQAEAAEQTEGEAAVNALFQNIYGKGSDEVRRAMNKSFIESGGTVLSTNWEEVKKSTVGRKPPDGMEWKSWNS